MCACYVHMRLQMLSVVGSGMSPGNASTCTQRVLSACVYSLGLLGPQCVLFACMYYALLLALSLAFISSPMIGGCGYIRILKGTALEGVAQQASWIAEPDSVVAWYLPDCQRTRHIIPGTPVLHKASKLWVALAMQMNPCNAWPKIILQAWLHSVNSKRVACWPVSMNSNMPVL